MRTLFYSPLLAYCLTRAPPLVEDASDVIGGAWVKNSVFLMSLIGFVLSIGCQGRIAPLAAQQGSTVVIPLNAEGEVPEFGYGGTVAEDYQRGTLIYRLGGPTGPELVTRASGQALLPPNAKHQSIPFFPRRQIVSVVDIPDDAPLGTHTIDVVRRRLEGGTPVDYPGPSYAGELTILPEEITFTVNGSPQTVTGAPTPFENYVCLLGSCGWSDATQGIRNALPLPELRIRLSAAVSALELEVQYPTDVIEVFDLYEPPGEPLVHPARVWYSESPAGSLQIGAVADVLPLQTIALAFSLVDGEAEILDAEDVTVTVVGAWDEDGDPLSVSVTSKTIF